MKITKRIATILLAICLMVPSISMLVQAAGGVIFFTDLETAVGETFTITGTVVTRNDVIGNATVKMSYDSSYIRFIEGDGVTKTADGQLTFTGTGDGRSDRIEFDMQFQALQKGSTRMEQEAASVTSQGGSTVACEKGYADISIAEGDPSLITAEATIEMDGVTYSVSSNFSASVLPTGFVAGEVTYKDTVYPGIVQENGDLQGLYLTGGDNSGSFYLYNPIKDNFYPCEEIMISEKTSIVILADTSNVKLDSTYGETSMAINGREFPVWTVAGRENFYVMYASNGDGVKGLYLYDAEEHTYQRMAIQEEKNEVTPEKTEKNAWTKLSDFVTDYFLCVFAAVVCALVVGIILIIVLAVKLRHRNLELDDLYDEYGIDLEDSPVQKNENRKQVGTKEDYLDSYDDEYEEEYEDEYEYEDEDSLEEFSDEYFEDEEDELADFREAFGEKKAEHQKKYDEYYDDDDYDDTDYEEDSQDELKDSVNTDTFEMDFIDFD